jgi:hypothetical protein
MTSHHQRRRNKMALPTNDDFANCELSIEELEAIAAGGFWSTLKHIGHDVAKVAGYGLIGAAYVAGTATIVLGVFVMVGAGANAASNIMNHNVQ